MDKKSRPFVKNTLNFGRIQSIEEGYTDVYFLSRVIHDRAPFAI
ncbi:hypothetical protein RAHE111665_02860 [Rariglobus hedericola]